MAWQGYEERLAEGLGGLTGHPFATVLPTGEALYAVAQARLPKGERLEPSRVVPSPASCIWSVASRTADGAFWFVPQDPEVAEVFRYVVAVMAAKYGMNVLAFCGMSNHYHLVVEDVRGKKGDFLRFLNSTLAKTIKVQLAEREGDGEGDVAGGEEAEGPGPGGPAVREKIFSDSGPGRVEVLEAAAHVAHFAYIAANPVKGGVVCHPRAWPGAVSLPGDIGRSVVIPKPRCPYLAGKRWPAQATLTVQPHPAMRDRPIEDVRKQHAKALKEYLEPIVAERIATAKKEGRPAFAGVASLANIDPRTCVPHPDKGSQRSRPKVLGVPAAVAMAYGYLLNRYHRAHAAIQYLWKQGVREVTVPGQGKQPLRFPVGAVVVPRQLGAPVEGAWRPPPEPAGAL